VRENIWESLVISHSPSSIDHTKIAMGAAKGKKHHQHSNSNNNNSKKKNKDKQKKKKTKASQIRHDNFVPEAGLGCHIARHPQYYEHHTGGDSSSSSWVLGWETIDDPEAYGDDVNAVPDIGINADERTISLCNMSSHETKVAYLTVYDVILHGRHGRRLRQGSTTTTTNDCSGSKVDDDSAHQQQQNAATTITSAEDELTSQPTTPAVVVVVPCTTFIVLCPPLTFCHLCTVPISCGGDLRTSLRIDSDVQVWQEHPDPADTYDRLLGFPLATRTTLITTNAASSSTANNNNNKTDRNNNDDIELQEQEQEQEQSYLCTQGVGGTLTHFFRGNYHAVDFQCAIGTPLLAVGNGTVLAVQDCHTNVSGIGTYNLYQWNSILIQLDQTDLAAFSPAKNDADPQQQQQQQQQQQDHHHDADDDINNDDDDDHNNKIVIRSSNELFVEYVHIQFARVRVGDRVHKGDVIGTSGSAVRCTPNVVIVGVVVGGGVFLFVVSLWHWSGERRSNWQSLTTKTRLHLCVATFSRDSPPNPICTLPRTDPGPTRRPPVESILKKVAVPLLLITTTMITSNQRYSRRCCPSPVSCILKVVVPNFLAVLFFSGRASIIFLTDVRLPH
jgi:murein DD-endopeptidase MepM/ murein hydrolase activator NlpD